MKIFWPAILISSLVLGYGGYQYGLYQIPFQAMSKAEQRLSERAGGYNQMLHPPRPTSKARTIVRPSPDQLYSACVYDLSHGPIEVSGTAPLDSYWSLSFFAHNTDNFFVINDRDLKQKQFGLILAEQDQSVPAKYANKQVVRSPSETGIIVQRVFIDKEIRAEELDQQRKTARCKPLES